MATVAVIPQFLRGGIVAYQALLLFSAATYTLKPLLCDTPSTNGTSIYSYIT